MVARPELETRLDELHELLESLPEAREPPLSTLRILRQTRSEDAWNRLLAYFIDPSQPHGFGADLLTTFLGRIEESHDISFEFRPRDLNVTSIGSEVSSEEGNRPDIVVRVPGKWFLCVECKVDSEEGPRQTDRYVDDPYIGDERKSEYLEAGQHYVFLSRGNAPDARADDFVDIYWDQVVEAFAEGTRLSRGQYPERSVSQLDDFLSIITEVTNMNEDDFTTIQREKIRLLDEFGDDIEDLFEAAESLRQRTAETWSEAFLSDEFRPDGFTTEWNCDPRTHGQLFLDGWRLDDDLSPTENSSEANRLRLHFVHLIRNRESFRNGVLTYQLRCPTNTKHRDAFLGNYRSDRWQDRLGPVLDERGIDDRAGSFKYTSKTYEVDQRELPESYFETLGDAFEEHVPVANIVSEILDESIAEMEPSG